MCRLDSTKDWGFSNVGFSKERVMWNVSPSELQFGRVDPFLTPSLSA